MFALDRCTGLWQLASVETYRRGNETTRSVYVVSDGVEWVQDFVDLHQPDAVGAGACQSDGRVARDGLQRPLW